MTMLSDEPAIEVASAPVRSQRRKQSADAAGPLTDAVIRIGASVVLGWLAILAGAVMVLVGYSRVDSSSSLAEQLAYFSSSCVGGLALIGLGGLAVLSRQYADARRAVEEIRRRASGESVRRATDQVAVSDGRVAIAEGGSTFHAADCALLDGRSDVRRVASDSSELRSRRACQICRPNPR